MKRENNKFKNYKFTASGEERASVKLNQLTTVWFNTGTLCNLKCQNCYIESSPTNDRLEYISNSEVNIFLKEIKESFPFVQEIGLTGGEPFINPDILDIITSVLSANFNILVLTNGYNILKRHHEHLLHLNKKHKNKIIIRVSLDHHQKEIHEHHRGEGTFEKTLEEIKWLSQNGFEVSIAGRSLLDESVSRSKDLYKNLFRNYDITINSDKKDSLIIFPEMTKTENTPEISIKCWDILNKSPLDQMCSSQRMIVKKKGASKPAVLPCTLLAYDKQFELGTSLKNANETVYLNHPYCSQFCILGGASCS